MKENQVMLTNSLKDAQDNQSQRSAAKKVSVRKASAASLSVLSIVVLSLVGCLAYHNGQIRTQVSQETSTVSINSITPTLTKSSETTDVSTAIESTELTMPMEWKTFTSELGFSFEYPAEWGEANEEIVESAQSDIGDSGSIYFLGFSSNEVIFAHGQSIDFSKGTGGGGYIGDPMEPKRITSTVYIRPSNCFVYSNAKPFSGWIDFNLPEQEITGVRLELPVLSEDEIDSFSVQYKTQNTENATCDAKIMAEQFFKEAQTKNLDEESLRNIYIFKKILNSSKIRS